ncbi:hypothetical protein, variant 1 [Verruconis gallopava]|uniref:WSC domain-containing protein n=1 Tax=Verruconis gallopava TaxID=253628 RepID=A0A0D2ATI9_9PEZI|nr:hypothetical protein, variant 1 [Verruconis gallopava]KIW02459.1 hypothetical protein, variant 1 [Verruconis gallopava]
MASTWKWRLSSLLCSFFVAARSVEALSNAYCSSQNTAGDVALQSIYMSMGKCHDTCISSYAFAILQGENCWCSNYIPQEQTSTSSCNTPCPGYPSDTCGNTSEGLYGYIKLNLAASGTASAASSTGQTSTSSAGPTSSSSLFTSSQEPLSSGGTTTTDNVPASSSSPITSVQVVTVSGSMVTQTVTSTPTTGSSALLGGQQKKTSNMSGGLIAAAVIASVFGVVIIAAVIFFVWRRRRLNHQNEKFGDINDNPSSPSNLNRNASTNSKAGLLDRAYPPTIATRVSSYNGLDMSSSDAVSPVTPNSDKRHSRPIVYDQRLNPNALMVIDNGSRASLTTLDDHRDYGRMLKVVNPDDSPRASFS